MAERELSRLLHQLQSSLSQHDYSHVQDLLSKAKLALYSLDAIVPSNDTPRSTLQLARETLETGAFASIRLKDPESFTRYFQLLQPFYELLPSTLPPAAESRSKVTGLYLLLLLSQGDYAGFHTLLEMLEVTEASSGQQSSLENDKFIQYPIKLEQWLMEGSYDKVWNATKSEQTPAEEYSVFSEVLVHTIRNEIASCSEKAYPSLPLSNAKNLLFLESERAVVEFAADRNWTIQDGRIHFPLQQEALSAADKDVLAASGTVIENTIGYARELETIV